MSVADLLWVSAPAAILLGLALLIHRLTARP